MADFLHVNFHSHIGYTRLENTIINIEILNLQRIVTIIRNTAHESNTFVKHCTMVSSEKFTVLIYEEAKIIIILMVVGGHILNKKSEDMTFFGKTRL